MGIIQWFKKRMDCPMDQAIVRLCLEDVDLFRQAKKLKLQVKNDVCHLCKVIKDELVLDYLAHVDVEEINREKLGIRVSLLKKNGYENILDLHRASPIRIANINGISDEGASIILNKVEDIVNIAYDECKLRLSEDHKTNKTSQLIHLLDISRQLTIDFDDFKMIEKLGKKLKVARSGVVWFFLSFESKNEILNDYEKFVQLLEGDYAKRRQVNKEILYEVMHLSVDDSWHHFSLNPYPFYSCLEKLYPNIIGVDDLKTYGLPSVLAKRIEKEPLNLEGLKCELRAYQVWGVKYILAQKRVLLGDEMGLGKTIQAIAAMTCLYNCGKRLFMVVCPASVLTNWVREVKKMSTLNVYKIYGKDVLNSLEEWKKEGGVAITTYETLNKFTLEEMFDFLIVDEAHYIKNPAALRTKNVISLSEKTTRLLFMTGTALENNVSEMIGLISLLQPTLTRSIENVAYLSTADRFKELIAPVYYRRKREDVLVELPELIMKEEWVNLNELELKAYKKALLSRNFSNVRRVSMDVRPIYDSSKVQRLLEIVEDARDDGRKVIVFSYFLETIKCLKELFPNGSIGPITGAVSSEQRQEMIDKFNQASPGTVLLAQIIAGGTGLNVQSASVVVIMEPQLKPSIENQAISRAYRMGQTRNVYVHRLLCENTIEQKMMERLENKQRIFDAFADQSAINMEEINEQSLQEMIDEEIRDKGGSVDE